ncbi:hypothetical protein [Roseibacillus persicicus]|uniref:hypothetical protein n=1 Tax=Roseibacillus persicicus TaxID=454148 RepID=UPI00280D0DA6|nr:hypothetical protein [Roseibacillus persicicus]MDQ8191162.1 hypothetical protein [Roseibacillus persicicus]
MKKSSLLVGLGALVVILAVVLLLRNPSQGPAGSEETMERQATASEGFVRKSAEQEGPATPLGSKSEPTEASAPSVSFGHADDEETQKMMAQMRDAMTQRNEAKATRLIEKWSKEMNLSPDQIGLLEEHFAKQVQLAGGLMGGDVNQEDPMENLKAMQHLEGKGLNDLMSELLTPEQKEVWEESEKKQQHRLADSGALKKLAGLNSVIEIREEQRDAIYEHFYQQRLAIETDSSEESVMSAVYNGISDGFGVEVNPYGFLDTDFSALVEEAAEEGGEIDVKELVRKQREQQIEKQVSELAPILDAEQLQSYREHLITQGSVIDSFMDFPTHDTFSIEPSIVVPEE